MLLALLGGSLALIGGGMHAGSTAIRFGTGLVAIAAHGGAGGVASEPAVTFIVSDLVLNPSIAADQAVVERKGSEVLGDQNDSGQSPQVNGIGGAERI